MTDKEIKDRVAEVLEGKHGEGSLGIRLYDNIEPNIFPLGKLQKSDCLFCENEAKVEAGCKRNGGTASIRCCDNIECVKRALDLTKI